MATLLVAVAGLIAAGPKPASAAPQPMTLTAVPESGIWMVHGNPASTLPDPITLTGTIESETGQFSDAALSIPSFQETNQGSTQEFTIAEVTPNSVSGRIDSDANLTIDAALSVTIEILTPIQATCVTQPIDVSLGSTAPYDPVAQQVTVSQSDFTIPNFPTTPSCPSFVVGPLNNQFAGSTGNALTITFAGVLPIPPPPGTPTETALDAEPVPGMTGQPTTLTADISSQGAPATDATGSVEFFDGPFSLGTAPVTAGVATTDVSTLAATTHSLTAVYSGDGQYESSTSPSVAYPVAAPPAFLAPLPPIVVIDAPEPTPFTGLIANPVNGQELSNVRLDFSFLASSGQNLFPEDVTFEFQDGNGDWQPITLSGIEPVTGSYGGSTGFPLAVGEQQTIPFRIAFAAPSAGTGNGTVTVTTALNLVGGDGAVVATLFSASGPMLVTPPERVPVTMTTELNNGGGAQVQGLEVPFDVTLAPQSNQSGPYTGTGQILLDGEPVHTETMDGPSIVVFQLQTDDWGVGAHTVQFVYSGDAVHAPAQSELLPFTILPRVGTLYECDVVGSGTTFTAAYDLTVLGNVPSSALPGTEIPVSDLLITGTGGAFTASSVDPTLVTLGLSPNGSGSAPDGASTLTPITSGPLAGSLDATLSITGASGTATVTGVPGDTVTVGLSNLTYQTNVFDLFVFDYECTPAGDPAVIGTVAVAGTTLAADPPGSVVEGDPTLLTATVAPPSSQGSVEFFADDTLLGTAPVIDGQAVLLTALEPGEHTLTAEYSGDLVNPASTSEPVPYEVIDSFTARFSDQTCTTLGVVADAAGLPSVAELIRTGVNGLRAVADAGGASPIANPPANDGPCEITVTWPAGEAALVADAAAAWGVTADQLHHLGGDIILYLIYLAIVGGG